MRVDVQRFIDFDILRSTIIVPNDCDSTKCDVHLTRVGPGNLMSDSKLSKIFFNRIDKYLHYSCVYIESSSFQGGWGLFFTVRQAGLKFSKTALHIQSHRTYPKNLIDFKRGSKLDYLVLEDVLINMTSIDRGVQQVNIMSLVIGFYSLLSQNIKILCPLEMAAVETVSISKSEPHVYHCEAACTPDMYTFQSGNMTLDVHVGYYDASRKSSVSNLNNPLCNRCPVGAKCSGDIKALPNYWGYRNKDEVVMIRCPTGYCCQDDESCQSFDSCSSRTSLWGL